MEVNRMNQVQQYDNNEVMPDYDLSVQELETVENQCSKCKHWDWFRGCTWVYNNPLPNQLVNPRPITDCGEFEQ
jgi:hypothetical protein